MTEEDYAELLQVQQRAYTLRKEMDTLRKFLRVAIDCEKVDVYLEAGLNESHCNGYVSVSGDSKESVLDIVRDRLDRLEREFSVLPSPSGAAR